MRSSAISIATFALVVGASVSIASTVQDPVEDVNSLEQLKTVGRKLAKMVNPVKRSRQQRHEPQCLSEENTACRLQDTCGEAHEFPITSAPFNSTGTFHCATADFCLNGDCQIPIGRNVCLSSCFTPGETFDKNFTARVAVYYRSEKMEYTLEDETETYDMAEHPYIKGCSECYSENFAIALDDETPTGRYIVRVSHIPDQGKVPLYDYIYEITVFNPKDQTPKDNGGVTVRNSLYVLLISVCSLLLRTM